MYTFYLIHLLESVEGFRVSAQDLDGNFAVVTLGWEKTPARNPEQARAAIERQLTRLGETLFHCEEFEIELKKIYILPASILNTARRELVEALLVERERNYPRIIGILNRMISHIPSARCHS